MKYKSKKLTCKIKQSLSSRRAWIEIKSGEMMREESITSLSSRRAWIEIEHHSNTVQVL